MPVGIIAAGVGAAGAIGAAAIGSGASKSAANKASQTAQQTNESNNALQRETRDINIGLETPWMQSGLRANSAINDLLGIGGPAPAAAPASVNPLVGGYGGSAYGGDYTAPDRGAAYGGDGGGYSGGRTSNPLMATSADDLYQSPMMLGAPAASGGAFAGTNALQPMPQAAPATPAMNVSGSSPYGTAFQNFLNSTGFQFQIDQGNKAINQGYAARGTLQSGAAMKSLQDRGQQTALNNYFLPYMNLLGQQQGVGLSATNATMGVGTNYANQVSANNNNTASNIANAQLASGAATANMWGQAGQSIGNIAGRFGSSYTSQPNSLAGVDWNSPAFTGNWGI